MNTSLYLWCQSVLQFHNQDLKYNQFYTQNTLENYACFFVFFFQMVSLYLYVVLNLKLFVSVFQGVTDTCKYYL